MTETLAVNKDAAEVVWSRAGADLGGGDGDRHLRALLLVDGIVRNCGPAHAALSCEPAELSAAAEACRYLGLDDLAAVMAGLPAATAGDDAERRVDDAYYDLAPEDETIRRAFEARFARTPGDFEAITARRFPRYHTAE
ncbi:hypothetical protein [Actinoplanes sp. NPDC023714]|uniref:hypothetical protein n=1 Tax=Actinoplanes sp. NPDC023714 TaxID=3154322 RepID=UPI00340D4E34